MLASEAQPRFAALRLLEKLSGFPLRRLQAGLQQKLPEGTGRRLQALLRRYQHDEPLAYLLGETDFWGLRIKVGPGVLIPRPDSETLVRAVLDWLRSERTSIVRGLDVCTGSACLSLALLHETAANAARLLPELRLSATDISEKALAYARKNRERILPGERGEELLKLYRADLWPDCGPGPEPRSAEAGAESSLSDDSGLPGAVGVYDFLISNPPYVSPEAYGALENSVRGYEPREALYAEEGGLLFYRRILDEGGRYLRPGAPAFLEHGADQALAVRGLLRDARAWSYERCVKDYAGRDRVTQIRYLGSPGAASGRRGDGEGCEQNHDCKDRLGQ